MSADIRKFVIESNCIENIHRPPTTGELDATEWFLDLNRIELKDLRRLVYTYATAALREHRGLDVIVGNHHLPPGGPDIPGRVENILELINTNEVHPYDGHQQYETLHPFMDGNGRSGRALWAWHMINHHYSPGLRLGFLHAWYYQSLQHGEARQT